MVVTTTENRESVADQSPLLAWSGGRPSTNALRTSDPMAGQTPALGFLIDPEIGIRAGNPLVARILEDRRGRVDQSLPECLERILALRFLLGQHVELLDLGLNVPAQATVLRVERHVPYSSTSSRVIVD